LLDLCQGEVWKATTACFGSDTACSKYKMECDPGQRIVVGQLMYGAKTNGQCVYGVSNCATDPVNVCCSYNSTDQFIDFLAVNR